MEQDGELFAKNIEPFILKRIIPGELSLFSENPQRWRIIRKESLLYGLAELSNMLRVTHSCFYSKGDDQGILYCLGTDEGTREYRNTRATGAVALHVGKIGDLTFVE
jgi:hypothetical protein